MVLGSEKMLDGLGLSQPSGDVTVVQRSWWCYSEMCETGWFDTFRHTYQQTLWGWTLADDNRDALPNVYQSSDCLWRCGDVLLAAS